MQLKYHIYPLGDHAITIDFGNLIDEKINQQCLQIASLLAEKNIPGVKDIIPAYSTISVIHDPVVIFHLNNIISPYEFIKNKTEELLKGYHFTVLAALCSVNIPICFDITFAPDLLSIAEKKKTSAEDIINIFLSKPYRVYMTGFLPGFAYMGKVDDIIATPRREKPHTYVAPGSIGIAGNQTGIYPLASPGGWNIIGRTPLRLFDKDSDDPCLLKAGDEVMFEEINIDEYHQLNQNH